MTGYEKLSEVMANEEPLAKRAAYQLVITMGWNRVKCATAHDVPDEIKCRDKDHIAQLARRIAATDIITFLGYIQRELESEPINGNGLPPYPPDSDTICPVCKKDMGDDCWDGDDSEYDSEGGSTAWECPHCGATGKALYGAPRFLSHDNVVDGKGEPFDAALH